MDDSETIEEAGTDDVPTEALAMDDSVRLADADEGRELEAKDEITLPED